MNPEDWKDWEAEIERKISVAVKERRAAKELFGKVDEALADSNIGWTWAKSGEDTIDTSQAGERTTILAEPEPKHIDPERIRIQVPGRFDTWFEDRSFYQIDPLLDDIGRRMSALETTRLIEYMIPQAHEVKAGGNAMSKSDVMNAAAWIRSHNHLPNVLLVSPDRAMELISKNEIKQQWDLPQVLWDKKGRYFVGFMNGIDVYWIAEIPSGICLLYEKNQTYAQIREVRVRIVDTFHQALEVEERCLAWVYDANALVKISLPGT